MVYKKSLYMDVGKDWKQIKYSYGQFGPEHLITMSEGISLFNQQYYWECHEVLEDPWIEDRADNARYVFWAVIQIAATLVHARDKKLNSANIMLKKAKEKFQKCDELKVVTPLLVHFLQWDELKKIVFSISESSVENSFEKLMNFKFNKFPFQELQKD